MLEQTAVVSLRLPAEFYAPPSTRLRRYSTYFIDLFRQKQLTAFWRVHLGLAVSVTDADNLQAMKQVEGGETSAAACSQSCYNISGRTNSGLARQFDLLSARAAIPSLQQLL